MIIPELPSYLTSLGGAEYKGFIIALFTLTAGISRPFSGKLTDTLGRIPVMAVGSLVCFVCSLLYPLLTSVSGFLFIRLLHGFSTGFKPTATGAYIADIIPKNRWGEALGLHGLFFSIGMAIGPAIGGTIVQKYSINTLFYISAIFALMSIGILINLKETLKEKNKFNFNQLKISKSDIIELNVLPAAIITFLSYFSFGVVLTLIPDWTNHLGILNKGLFFITYTLASMLIRVFAGKASDNYGRIKVINVGLVILIFAMFTLGYFQTLNGLILGSILYGISTGVLSPAANAWTVDLSNPEYRGRAMATMYIAMEAGIGIGAIFAGFYYNENANNIPIVMYISSIVTFVALIYMIFRNKYHKKL